MISALFTAESMLRRPSWLLQCGLGEYAQGLLVHIGVHLVLWWGYHHARFEKADYSHVVLD
jgi:hypothetical protein